MKSGPRGESWMSWVSVAVLSDDKGSARSTLSLCATRLVMRSPCVDCDGKAGSPYGECGSIERRARMGEACARCATAVRRRATRFRVWSVRTVARRRVAVLSLREQKRALHALMASSSDAHGLCSLGMPKRARDGSWQVVRWKGLTQSFQALCGRPPEPNGRPRSVIRRSGPPGASSWRTAALLGLT